MEKSRWQPPWRAENGFIQRCTVTQRNDGQVQLVWMEKGQLCRELFPDMATAELVMAARYELERW